ncbi:MAG: ATP phosphoribosyltransferase [Actinobacteria bacterium]|nr:ATP phosphoribosyltransferase [Actinomycetota bacterium]MDI6830003.1 ATP phosphoribosyltransferase [Actinomycetota bacterium]
MLKLVIPKGSLENTTLEILRDADLAVRRSGDREYHAAIDDPRIEQVRILRPQEIPKYVEDGFFDLGITGYDWIRESRAQVEEVADLPYTKTAVGTVVRVVLAVAGDSPYREPRDLPDGVRVSTEYPNLVADYFRELGIKANIYLSYGATEAKVPEMADAVVELTETGGTLRKHGLRIIDTVLESTTRLIANRESYAEPRKRELMEELRLLILGALNARGKVLIKFNVAEKDLEEVVRALPSLKAPTLSRLHGEGYYAVESVVEKKGINLLIPELVKKGAEDIIELPISKIIA